MANKRTNRPEYRSKGQKELKPRPVPPTTLDQVAGCLKYDGPALTIEEMDEGIRRAIRRRHAEGRY
jgi:hypothetical protein